jgi:hypothetical protein
MEEWHRKGHPVDPTENGISLRARVGEKNYALGYLAPALARHPGTIILAWRALQRYQVFPAEAIEAFQTAVSASTSLTYTETNAHLAVTEEFGKEAAKALVRELDRLAQTGDPARDIEVALAWDPDLPQVNVSLTNESMRRLQETFRRCEPPIREIFARLMQGWADVGGTVECRRPGRVYLKLRTAEHEYGKCRAGRSPGEAGAGHRPTLEPGPRRLCLPELRSGGGWGVSETSVGAAGVLG